MRIGDDGGGALLQHTFRKAEGMGHGRLDVYMAVDEAGAEIGARCIDLLLAGIGSDAKDDAVSNGHITLLDDAREHVDDVRVFDDQGGVA